MKKLFWYESERIAVNTWIRDGGRYEHSTFNGREDGSGPVSLIDPRVDKLIEQNIGFLKNRSGDNGVLGARTVYTRRAWYLFNHLLNEKVDKRTDAFRRIYGAVREDD